MALTKKRKVITEGIDTLKLYTLEEVLKMTKERAKSKFDETIDVAVKLGVDPRHADQNIRGMLTLPHSLGKTIRVAVFAKGAKADEAKAAGADIVGADDLAEIVQGGKLDFDRCIATPDMMVLVGKLGKILGTKGLMPNPKLGTVTMDVAGAVKLAKAGQIEYRVEKAGIIHAGIGKASFTPAQLTENIKAFIEALQRAKPSGTKGVYLQQIVISSTMGVGLRVDVTSLTGNNSAAAA